MWRQWVRAVRTWAHQGKGAWEPPRIGLALGGGFARCLAHVGIIQVLEENQIPLHAIAGISSGAVVAAAYASGTPLDVVLSEGAATSFSRFAKWTLSRMGLASNERMNTYLQKILRSTRFEDMRIPLAVVATDLVTGSAVAFRGRGDIIAPVRASCAYPGMFLPVEIDGRWLVDGAIAANVPVAALLDMGCTRVVAVSLQTVNGEKEPPGNVFQVVSRCFAIMQERLVAEWREQAHLVLEPDVSGFAWDDYGRGNELVLTGRKTALSALPALQAWLGSTGPARAA